MTVIICGQVLTGWRTASTTSSSPLPRPKSTEGCGAMIWMIRSKSNCGNDFAWGSWAVFSIGNDMSINELIDMIADDGGIISVVGTDVYEYWSIGQGRSGVNQFKIRSSSP